MPNHVRNIVTVTGKGAKEILDSLSTLEKDNPNSDSDSVFDFNKIIQRPQVLVDTEASSQNYSIQQQIYAVIKEGDGDEEKIRFGLTKLIFESSDEERCRRLVNNFLDYGHFDWYEWSIANWGTKWNSYDGNRIRDNQVFFNTAWGTPQPIIKALSEKYPKNKFTVRYADEDTGYNCGTYTYQNGEVIKRYHPEFGTSAARNYSHRIWGN